MALELKGRRGRGFTLMEVMVAGALLLVITLGTLPLFTRSLIDNRSGAESTEVSNVARSQIEELFQLPWESPRMVLVAGDLAGGTIKAIGEYYSLNSEAWTVCTAPMPDCDPANCAVPDSDPARWVRVTCVRQFSNDAVTDDGVLSDDEALPSTAPGSQVHLKEIVVRVAGARQSPVFGPAKRLTIRTLKSQ